MRSRTLGWVQDPSDFTKLRKTVEVFSSTSNRAIRTTLTRSLSVSSQPKADLLKRLAEPSIRCTFTELIGSKGKTNGIVPAILEGQTAGKAMSTWACSGFLAWAHALGFLDYQRSDDSFGLTLLGSELLDTSPGSAAERAVFTTGLLSYPPAPLFKQGWDNKSLFLS